MENRKQAVLEVAKKGNFDNILKVPDKWQGYDVWVPCGPNGETLYLGAVVFVDMGTEVKPYILKEAEKILDELADAAGIEDSEFCD